MDSYETTLQSARALDFNIFSFHRDELELSNAIPSDVFRRPIETYCHVQGRIPSERRIFFIHFKIHKTWIHPVTFNAHKPDPSEAL